MDLVDPFGRVIRDLRISVTDRCNFRCTYCMPEEGMKWLPRSDVLTFEEIERLARIFVERFEVDGLRLTGGEPTVRAHLPRARRASSPRCACRLHQRRPSPGAEPDLSITTNGATFRLLAHDLREAGLDRVNISLDTLRPRPSSSQMTRRDELAQGARRHRGRQGGRFRAGEDQRRHRAWCQRRRDRRPRRLSAASTNVEVRFIEFMPLDASGHWVNDQVVSQDEIVAAIDAVYPLEQVPARGAAPADRWRYLDGRGMVGVIPTVTKPFCGDCDRVRLTADGQFRTCLFATTSSTCCDSCATGATDDDLAMEIERAVGTKWAGHRINQVNFIRPNRTMSQIGG